MATPVSQQSPAAGQPQESPDRPGMADPGAWAVTAFATTSFMLGMYNSGLLNLAGVPVVIPVAFFFGGLIQIIVAIMEISRGNLFGAVVFGSYGPFWVIFGALEALWATSIPAAQLNSALCLFLAMWAVLTFIFFIASLRTDAVLVGIVGLIFVGLVLLSIGYGASQPDITKAGGWVTLAFAVLAWYHAAGDIISATFGRPVLPVWSLRR
jgi:uncharacterized protein